MELGPGLTQLGLEQRLADAPAGAQVRGLFFKLAEQALQEGSPDLLVVWRTLVGARSRWPFSMYPLRDFIREQAVAAVLLDHADPGGALFRMWRVTPRLSPLIRAEAFMRYLTKQEPQRALAWLSANRRMMCDHGEWRFEPTGPRGGILHFVDEYVWLEHAQLGGLTGTLDRCGVSPSISIELDGPYSGRLVASW